MTVSPFLRPLGIAAAILGTLQGLTWTILSLLVILLSSESWIPDYSNFKNMFNIFAYQLFFQSNILDSIFNGTTVLVFAIIYLVISFVWMVCSMTLTWIFMREKYENARLSSLLWSAITIFTTVFDLVLIIILSIDLENLSIITDPQAKYIVSTVLGISMIIAARGFVLLIINPIIALFLFKLAKDLQKTPKPIQDSRPFSAISAYQSPNTFNWDENPRSPGPESPNNYNNQMSPGYQPDEDPAYHRSVSQLHNPPMRRYVPAEPAIPGRPQQKPRAPQVPNLNIQRDPRDNNNMRDMRDPRDYSPHIPDPDYDNPRRGELERMPRSALRTKSYY